jgi:hypothetical protein
LSPQATVLVNSPPVPGSVSITPQGSLHRAVVDLFRVESHGWADQSEDLPLAFLHNPYYHCGYGTGMCWYFLTAFQSATPTLPNVRLPAMPDGKALTIVVRAIDQLGAAASAAATARIDSLDPATEQCAILDEELLEAVGGSMAVLLTIAELDFSECHHRRGLAAGGDPRAGIVARMLEDWAAQVDEVKNLGQTATATRGLELLHRAAGILRVASVPAAMAVAGNMTALLSGDLRPRLLGTLEGCEAAVRGRDLTSAC